MDNSEQQIKEAVTEWVEKAVIGLNLCPFAKSVHKKNQIRFKISHSQSIVELCGELSHECIQLADADEDLLDTTLLITPQLFEEFVEFNDFLDLADQILITLGLDDELQIASFHPRYQFDGTAADDLSNYTNRAPYPILHLLRQKSLNRAIESYPDTAEIYQRNINRMNKLGLQGWHDLFKTGFCEGRDNDPAAVSACADGNKEAAGKK